MRLAPPRGMRAAARWSRLLTSVLATPLDAPCGNRKFVRALSHAINRPQMNDVIYFGRGVPSQVTAHPTSRWYEERFANAHTRYDPDYSRELLD